MWGWVCMDAELTGRVSTGSCVRSRLFEGNEASFCPVQKMPLRILARRLDFERQKFKKGLHDCNSPFRSLSQIRCAFSRKNDSLIGCFRRAMQSRFKGFGVFARCLACWGCSLRPLLSGHSMLSGLLFISKLPKKYMIIP